MTAKGQTVQELAEEFIAAMKATASGSKDMDVLFDAAIAAESKPPTPNILDAIENVAGIGFNARNISLIAKNKIRVTDALLAYICIQSSGIPAYIYTVLGLFATYFYAHFPKDRTITLAWLGETVGKGKLNGFRQVYPWAAVAIDESKKNIFEDMDSADLYTFEPRLVQ